MPNHNENRSICKHCTHWEDIEAVGYYKMLGVCNIEFPKWMEQPTLRQVLPDDSCSFFSPAADQKSP